MAVNKAEADVGKLDLTLVPPALLEAVARVLEFGAKKYTRRSYDTVPDAEVRYYRALRRHLHAFESGEDLDPETELHHLIHAAANVAILVHFLAQGRDVGAWRD